MGGACSRGRTDSDLPRGQLSKGPSSGLLRGLWPWCNNLRLRLGSVLFRTTEHGRSGAEIMAPAPPDRRFRVHAQDSFLLWAARPCLRADDWRGPRVLYHHAGAGVHTPRVAASSLSRARLVFRGLDPRLDCNRSLLATSNVCRELGLGCCASPQMPRFSFSA